MSKKKVTDIPSGFGAPNTLREEVEAIVADSSLSYDQKAEALQKRMHIPRHEAVRILGPDPKDEITLKDPLGDETLFLVIMRKFFDKIMSGEKREEYRHISEVMPGRYTYRAKDGRRYLRPYGKIMFAVGYHKRRDMALVEVTDIKTNGECVTFRLGRIIEHRPKE